MSNFKTFNPYSYFVAGRHYTVTINIYSFISAKGITYGGSCRKCNRSKYFIVPDAKKTEAEGLKDFFMSVGKNTINFGKKFFVKDFRNGK